MKIIVTSIGTRGDMEPFLAIAELLKRKGHEVICLFPEQFRNLAVDTDCRFESLGTEFIDMLNSETGKFALGGGGAGWRKILAYIKLAKLQSGINKKLVMRQQEVIEREQPDRIVHNGKAMYPVMWEHEHPNHTIFVSPVPYLHYVKKHTHLAFHSNFGEFLNKLTYNLADWGLIKTIRSSAKMLGKNNISSASIKRILKEHKVLYTISPQLFSRPEYWAKNIQVVGYHERDKAKLWQASDELKAFLKDHSNPLFITFGSMTNPQPHEKTQAILNVLQRNQIPAIINTSAGGLVEPKSYDRKQFHFTSSIPYDWILPKCKAMVHHGGSGTTHMAIKNDCPSLIIPHIIDQFLWNDIVAEKGLGPHGIKIGKLNENTFEPLLLDLMQNENYSQMVKEAGEAMRNENFSDILVQYILNT